MDLTVHDINNLTFHLRKHHFFSCWMGKYTFGNTALQMAIGNLRNLQFLVLNGPIFLSWKLKNNFKKVNLIN